MQKISVKKCFLLTVYNWIEKFSQGHSKVADDETEVHNG
jgi:hypothetical protein